MDIPVYLGKQIKKYRKLLNLTQSELSKRVNIGLTTLSGYERGANSPDIETLYKLANALNVSINDLFPSEKTNNEVILEDLSYELNNSDNQQKQLLLRSLEVVLELHRVRKHSD